MDGEKYARMILRAAETLAESKLKIDALNVFPVPDGDTGTNMYLTMASAAKEVESIMPAKLGAVAEAAARGALMGARGNSGVILSQLLRGIAKVLKDKQQANSIILADALHNGTEVAYRAVMKPVEGTILTVARGASQAAKNAAKEKVALNGVLAAALAGGRAALAETPKMLPILAQSGVVDAGGKGWEVILSGFLAGANDAKTILTDSNLPAELARPLSPAPETVEIAYRYCTELLIKGQSLQTDLIRNRLNDLGDSLLVVGTDETVKVHLHTNQPGQALEICLEFGEIYQIKVDNMALQHRQVVPEGGQKPVGTVVVASGSGLEEVFFSLGADEVISGGQTMNPSAEEIARAIAKVPAEHVIILPNNSNIILTAQLVRKLTPKNVEVIPTRSIQQGIAAMLAFTPEKEPAECVRLMQETIKHIISGEVTFAVRDTFFNDKSINKGDILGIIDDEIKVAGQDINAVTLESIISVLDDSKEILSVYYGADITADQANALMTAIVDKWPQLETEMHYGGQPLYYYLFSVE